MSTAKTWIASYTGTVQVDAILPNVRTAGKVYSPCKEASARVTWGNPGRWRKRGLLYYGSQRRRRWRWTLDCHAVARKDKTLVYG